MNEVTHRSTQRMLSDLPRLEEDKIAVLAEFTSEQQQKIVERAKILGALANAVGGDSTMRVRIGKAGGGWYWSPATDAGLSSVTLDARELLERPFEYCRMVICHEGFHRWLSRFSEISDAELKQPGFHMLWNVIEDPRINNAGVDAHPVLEPDLRVAYETILFEAKEGEAQDKEKLGFVPSAKEAAIRLIGNWYHERSGFEHDLLEAPASKQVADFLEFVKDSSSEAWNTYPSTDELKGLSKQEEDKLIREYCRASWQIIRDDIWPEFQKLIEQDKNDAKSAAAFKEMLGNSESAESSHRENIEEKLSDSARKEVKEAADRIENGASKLSDEFRSLSEETKKELREALEEQEGADGRSTAKNAEEALGEAFDEFAKKLGRKSEEQTGDETFKPASKEYAAEAESPDLDEISENIARQFREIKRKTQTPYQQYLEVLAQVIGDTENALRRVFRERRESHCETGLKTGPIFDVSRRIQERAAGVKPIDSHAFKKRTMPLEKDYAITLLVDMSGSMARDDRIQEALKGAIVLSEVLKRIGIQFEVVGFHDELKTYKSFSLEFGKKEREEMMNMLAEVQSDNANWNDDGWALRESAVKLGNRRESEKHLIVISDGEPIPSPEHSGAKYELSRVIASIRRDSDINLIGLGLGRGTSHVSKYYPNSVANISVRDLPTVISDLIKGIVSN